MDACAIVLFDDMSYPKCVVFSLAATIPNSCFSLIRKRFVFFYRSIDQRELDRSQLCTFFFQWFSDARVHRLIESFIYETILSTVCFYFVFNPKMELNLIMKSVAKWLNGKKTIAIIYRLIVLFRKSTPINTARNTTKYVEWMSANWMWTVSETINEINQWHKHWWIKESPRLFDIAERSL